MVRRIIVSICIGLVCLYGVTAANLPDGFSFLQEDPLYIQFISAVRVEGNIEKAEGFLALLHAQTGQRTETTVKQIRTNTAMARLYVETNHENSDRVEQLLTEAEQKLKLLEKDSFYELILASEIDGIWYLENPKSLGKGISSSRNINKAFKEYPQEISSRLLKANSMLYAPSFAGGDIKGSLNMFLALQKDGASSLSPWDLSSLYSGIGIACFKLKDYQNAQGYLAAAKAIYPFDAVLDDYIAQVEKEL